MKIPEDLSKILLLLAAIIIPTGLVIFRDTDPFGSYLVAIIFFLWVKDHI